MATRGRQLVTLDAACDDARIARLQAGHRRSIVARDVKQKLATLPAWSWAHVGTPEFKRAVSEPMFRELAKHWSQKDGSLLLLGPTGVGKTTSIVALVNRIGDEALASGDLGLLRKLVWTKGYAISNARRYAPLGTEPLLLAQCREASLLVIDECTQEPISDGALFEIIDNRCSRQVPTFVTSGLSRTAFREKYGDALDRRLTQEGLGVGIESVLKTAGLRAVK